MRGTRPTQNAFVQAKKSAWDDLANLLSLDKGLHKLPADRIGRVGQLYRAICADLMRARSSGYSRDLVAYLDDLAARAHNSIYRAEPYRMRAAWEMIAWRFPQTLRRNWRFFAAACALFLIPFAITLWATLRDPAFAVQIMPQGALEEMAANYSEGFGGGRSEGTDTMMAGFYVYNNIGIAFRCFATGIFFGLGSIYFLVFNGLFMGAVMGYFIDAGSGRNIITFVLGHGAFELTAIVISGAAGMRMGYALVATEGRTRLGSLRASGPDVATLVLGAAVMLAIAALIEGFWSPSAVADPIKWSVAGGLWLTVAVYLALAGRGRGEQRA